VCSSDLAALKFEEFQRGLPLELLERVRAKPPKGEFVVMIEPGTREERELADEEQAPDEASEVPESAEPEPEG
jgi:16S rRNA C1402 (ribose-2'-O) methylase RsmI